MKGLCQRPGCPAAGLCVLQGVTHEPLMAPSHCAVVLACRNLCLNSVEFVSGFRARGVPNDVFLTPGSFPWLVLAAPPTGLKHISAAEAHTEEAPREVEGKNGLRATSCLCGLQQRVYFPCRAPHGSADVVPLSFPGSEASRALR